VNEFLEKSLQVCKDGIPQRDENDNIQTLAIGKREYAYYRRIYKMDSALKFELEIKKRPAQYFGLLLLIGYPYSYGDDLTPKMAGNNRKQAVSYSVLIPSIWWHNLGFREPIQSYSPFSNEPKTAIVRVVETSRVNSINRGGDLGKSGPGPRAKADALKNARKTGGGSIFVQGFTPKRQYGSRPINKPLSCRNNVKINEEQFNGNKNTAKQTNQDCTLTREQRRNLTHPDDVRIPDQDVKIRHGQAKYKVKNYGSDFSLPSKPNEK
jgi:hypothetical protein